jgi:putative RecB family exonuclease
VISVVAAATPAAAAAGKDGAGQLALDGMPRRLFQCTPSKLAAFDCPRRYRMTYLDRPQPQRGPPWAHNTVGATVHLALARWWDLPRPGRTPDGGARLVQRSWQSNGFRDDAQSAIWAGIAAQWVEQYLDEQVDPDDVPVGVERTVAVPLGGLAVSGRVDRVDDRGDEIVIVDYKTGRRSLTTDDARGSQALALYVLGARRTLRRRCSRVELHHLPTGNVAAFDHTDESLARHVARADATAQDIETATDTLAAGAAPDDVFPPRPAPSCSWCDFRRHCPQGREASPDLDPWAGLGTVD